MIRRAVSGDLTRIKGSEIAGQEIKNSAPGHELTQGAVLQAGLLARDTEATKPDQRGVEAFAVVVVQGVTDRFQLAQQAVEVARHRDAAYRLQANAIAAEEA